MSIVSAPRIYPQVTLQVLLMDDCQVQVTDGKNRVHLNYGKESETIESLKRRLEEFGKPGDALDDSVFDFGEFSFSCHLKDLSEGSSQSRSLIISLDLQDLELAKPISGGYDKERPSGTFYLALDLANSRRDRIMKQLVAGEETLKSVSKISGLEIDELIGSYSHQKGSNQGISQTNNLLTSNEEYHETDEDQTGGIGLLGINWDDLPEIDQPVVVPQEADEFWLKFDDTQSKIVDRGIICESLEDFVKQSMIG